jgi:hypothetical protein
MRAELAAVASAGTGAAEPHPEDDREAVVSKDEARVQVSPSVMQDGLGTERGTT